MHAALQQTPSAQKPVPHWLPAPHVAPGSCFGTHTPAEHQLPAAQSLSAAQVPTQAVAPQAKVPQAWVWSGGQLPLPPQRASSVAVPPVHEASLHTVVSTG